MKYARSWKKEYSVLQNIENDQDETNTVKSKESVDEE
jgi:hypothetical protein